MPAGRLAADAVLDRHLTRLSTTSPLLQRWFASTGHPSARDPYFLYAASNAGSLLALLAYPFLIEPHVRLAAQGRWWAVGYGGLVALSLAASNLATSELHLIFAAADLRTLERICNASSG